MIETYALLKRLEEQIGNGVKVSIALGPYGHLDFAFLFPGEFEYRIGINETQLRNWPPNVLFDIVKHKALDAWIEHQGILPEFEATPRDVFYVHFEEKKDG